MTVRAFLRQSLSLSAMLLALHSSAVFAAAVTALPDLHWRLLGPFRGGWSTMAVGVPDQPDTFYFASAGGGVWKTGNAGQTWAPMFDGAGSASSIGAIAVAPSDSRTIYVGSGQPEPRYDIAAGDGVYKSTDSGAHWQHVGLEATRHIGAILIDPKDANTLLVGALGHIFGPNAKRGVFRSTDGGAHWQQTLKIDSDTGVVDLAADPAQPNLIFAAAWTARNFPWLSYFTPIVGAGSGIYKSADGGLTWTRLGGTGWPGGALGRIGLAVTHTAQGTRIYASIDSEESGGLYRSDDGGAQWQKVNDAEALASWYNSRIMIVPNDPDTLYTIGQSIHRSTDGGKTFSIIKGAPGGDDYHYIWINPKHPDHWITASDQGTVVSVDAGASWSSWYNQPTGQFYHLAADNRFPYWIYAGQQDSGSVGIASRSDYGAPNFRDWHPVGADERDDDVPDPLDPDIVYGSGLGGRISRWDAKTGQVATVTPWPVSSYGKRPTTVKYRYTWITPLSAAPIARYAIYTGAQVLFKSTDHGDHWQTISPDLTGKQDGALRCDGDVAIADAKACGYGVIFNIAASPLGGDEIWVGTDDGLIQLTRDGGAHWSNVTPPTLPAWARINDVDPSALDDGTAYAVADNHRQDDFAPHVYRTHDFGKTWRDISAGLPAGHFATTVRADPQTRGLLYAGTDAGVYVSLDDGAHWQPLQLNLPQAWVRDLLVHGDDLIVATQGRAIWVLDDVTPLRQLAGKPDAGTQLFTPAVAYRVRSNNNHDTPLPPETPAGENPPSGAIIDYQLSAKTQGAVTLDILDASGRTIRHFSSSERATTRNAERYFADAWVQPFKALAASPGAHRFIWDLRQARPQAIAFEYSIAAVPGVDTPLTPQGAFALPGNYQVVLRAEAREWRAPLIVKLDPRIQVSADDLARSQALSKSIADALSAGYVADGEAQAVHAQLQSIVSRPGASLPESLQAQIKIFGDQLTPLIKKSAGATMDFATLDHVLTTQETDLEAADVAPTAAQQAVFDEYQQKLNATLGIWQSLSTTALSTLNAQLAAAKIAPVTLPPTKDLQVEAEPGGADLP